MERFPQVRHGSVRNGFKTNSDDPAAAAPTGRNPIMRNISPDLIFAVSAIVGTAVLIMFVMLCLNVSAIRRELERQGRAEVERWTDEEEAAAS